MHSNGYLSLQIISDCILKEKNLKNILLVNYNMKSKSPQKCFALTLVLLTVK